MLAEFNIYPTFKTIVIDESKGRAHHREEMASNVEQQLGRRAER